MSFWTSKLDQHEYYFSVPKAAYLITTTTKDYSHEARRYKECSANLISIIFKDSSTDDNGQGLTLDSLLEQGKI